IKYIKTLKKQTIFIFSSDHGELIGERGKIGHNTFQKEVYKVPLIIFDTLNSDIEYQNMEAHNDIYNLIFYLLGYSKEFREPSKSIRVNGSMINEEDGYMEF
ncbi:MAG: hypothetical protein U9Q29_08070, partial [Campylobacterota bacterium]|nr:hypothetical protein [Campylobacterota bacterium]